MTAGRTAREARKGATRAGLLDAAITLFHDRGYGATTADDVAAAIGQTKGAFYFHFATKEDCFLEVLRHRERLRGEWHRMPERYDPRTTSLDEVLRVTMAALATSMGGRASFALAMADFWLATQPSKATLRAFRAIYAGWIDEITAFVTALQAGGWVSEDLDPPRVAAEMLALVDGFAIHQRLYGADTTELVFDALRELLTR
jgi:AcrR family transcriptional regulator